MTTWLMAFAALVGVVAYWRWESLGPAGRGFVVILVVGLLVAMAAWETHRLTPILPPSAEAHWEADGKALRSHYMGDIQALLEEAPAGAGFAMHEEGTDQSIYLQADRSFELASIYKLFVCWYTLSAIEAGEVAANDPLPGYYGSFRTALTDMITWSDNDSAEALGGYFNWQTIIDALHAKGYRSTVFETEAGGQYVNYLASTPRDVLQILRALTEGKLLDPSRTAYFMDLLRAQKLNNTLGPSLEPGMVYGHKTGWLDDVFHDAGFIEYKGELYQIAIMSAGWTSGDPAAEDWYRRIGLRTAHYLVDREAWLAAKPPTAGERLGALKAHFKTPKKQNTEPSAA